MSLSLRAKLIGGFSIVALIALVIGVIGWWGVNTLSRHLNDIAEVRMTQVENLLSMDTQFQSIVSSLRALLNPELTQAERDQYRQELAQAREIYGKAKESYKKSLTTSDEIAKLDQLVAAITAWRAESDKFTDDVKSLEDTDMANALRIQRDVANFIGDHYKAGNSVAQLIMQNAEFSGGDDATACRFGKWLQTNDFKNPKVRGILERLSKPHQRFHAAIGEVKQLVKAGKAKEAQECYAREMMPAAKEVFAAFGELEAMALDARETVKRMNHQALVVAEEKQEATLKVLDSIRADNTEATKQAKDAAHTAANWASWLTGVAVVAGVLIALILGIAIATTVTRSLNRVIDGLNSSADQVAAAADQVSSAGQDLAQGASEQASSLEETSASLEEMNSMTKQNAENAYNADAMSKTAAAATGGGVKAMDKMSEAISKIKDSSDQTAKIIKTIDEIAFQTNLLALNAAVEAARAGEAGKGFAVVAEEVRNLAQRSAEAAKNTSALIEGSQSNSEEGVRVAKEVGESLANINGNVAKVGALISEISSASGEQSKGIDQISRAVSEMDKLTQQNASNSEESASAAEELSAQAGELKGMVGQLVAVVTGTATEERVADLRRPPRRPQPQAAPRRQLAPAAKAPAHKAAAAPAKRISESQAEKVIPLDDDDFKDF